MMNELVREKALFNVRIVSILLSWSIIIPIFLIGMELK